MPYQIQISNEGRDVLTTYYGTVTSSELYDSFYERFLDINKLSKMRVVCSDLSDVTELSLQTMDVKKLANICIEASKHNTEISLVVIMPTDIEFGTGRMWGAYLDNIQWKVMIVRSREEAEAWLSNITTKSNQSNDNR